jgi:hypothetical protein
MKKTETNPEHDAPATETSGAGQSRSHASSTATQHAGSHRVAHLIITPNDTLDSVPVDYTGLSIETLQLADPNYFSPDNPDLVALFRRLSAHGVLRLGGNSSEFCWWRDSPDALPPVERTAGQGRADNWMPQAFHAITPNAIDNLAGFLNATGWTLIYGLNFGTGSPERDASQAAYVAHAAGPRLQCFQIGNEPDFYCHSNNLLRPAGWDFGDYLNEWTAIADAVSARVSDARFGGPDMGASSDWVIKFAETAPARVGARLTMLSGHYYAEGPPDSPGANIASLLAPKPGVAKRMNEIMPVVRRYKLDYRMTEGNSCYRGGKAGMSNAFAAALWGGDYMLEMASLGCKGVNFHGGGGSQISASLGGKLPGARDAADLAMAKLGSFYSPIAGSLEASFSARPIFYGMMLAEQFAGTTLVRTVFDSGGVNATAYTAGVGNGYRIALFNKDDATDLAVTIAVAGVAPTAAQIWRLTAPALDAISGVTLAGAEIGRGGEWRPAQVARRRIDCRVAPRQRRSRVDGPWHMSVEGSALPGATGSPLLSAPPNRRYNARPGTMYRTRRSAGVLSGLRDGEISGLRFSSTSDEDGAGPTIHTSPT